MLVDRVLTRLEKEDPELRITRIDVVAHPLIAWKNSIRMIPALRSGDRVLSGILPGEEEIRRFIASVRS
ncbi:MAG: hypothetical protein Kow0089_21940 [Desulfobulbaceae bacterium]